MKKNRRPMSEIAKDIKKNNKKKPLPQATTGSPTTRGEFLELCIKFTQRAKNDASPGLFDDQERRLTEELKKWRKNEGKN